MQNFVINAKADVSTVDIIGDIGDGFFSDGITMESINNQLKEITSSEIVLNISSLGGNVFDAFAIYDLIKLHPAHVTSKIMGVTASAGTIIALAGDQVEISENALFLIHNASALSGGKAKDLRHTAEQLDKIDSRLVSIYKKKTGKNITEIKALMEEDKFIDAKEALSFGFVNSIFKPLRAAASITDERKTEILNKLKDLEIKNEQEMEFEQKFNELKAWIQDSFQAKEKPVDFEAQVNSKIEAFEKETNDYKTQVTDLSENVATIQAAKEALEADKTALQAAFDALQIKADKSESDYNALKATKTEVNQLVDPKLEEEKAEVTALGSEFLSLLKESQKETLKNKKK